MTSLRALTPFSLFFFFFCMFVRQVAELEAQLGHPVAGEPGGEELSQSVEELRALVSAKEQVRAAGPLCRPTLSARC